MKYGRIGVRRQEHRVKNHIWKIFHTRDLCRAHLTQTCYAQKAYAEMRINMKEKKNKKTQQSKAVKNPKPSRPRKRIWTFSKRLMALCLVPMLVVCVLVATISTVTLSNTIEGEIESSLQIVAASVNETYTNLYEGDYTKDNGGRLLKGGTKISGNNQLLDALKEKTGFDVSMMYGNMRLLTTVEKENGARANGTATDKEVFAHVESGETVFLENFEIAGRICYALYEPLINSDGTIIGAIEVSTDGEGVQKTITSQVVRIFLFSLVLAVIAAIAVWILSRTMVVRMERIRRFLERLINGRLDHEPNEKNLKVNDELGDIYRNCVKVQDTFNAIVGEIKTSCDNLKFSARRFSDMAQETTESADEVKVAVEQISDGARNQAEHTSEAHDSVTMISSQINLITQEVDDMAEYAKDMSAKEKQSEMIIGELSASNDHTKESVSKVAEQIALMNKAVGNIKVAVEMIQSIADETDLLSLNASIEAARAGEAGRGFAVVAEQICKLALQSNESSKDIEKILTEITDTSRNMVAVMEEVRTNMDVQQTKLEETRDTYRAVAEGVDKSLENIGNIKEKIDILNASGESINNVVENLAAISEQNTASATETMETAKNMSTTMQKVQESSSELLSLADKLQESLGSFRI